MLNQKESVFNCISNVVNVDSSVKVVLSGDEMKNVIEIVMSGFEKNEIVMSEGARDKYIGSEKLLRKYCDGLVRNWLRKDIRLNGGVKHEIKNPGSRCSDSILKNLKLLKSSLSDESKIKEVEEGIEKRLEEIRVNKVKKVEIDFDKIPEELRKSLGL